MEINTAIFQGAQKAFNNIKIMKGQYMTIATCDREGNPNVAPIGSMRILDDKTVHVLQGFLPKTFNNLQRNPKASFSVCIQPSLLNFLFFFRGQKSTLLGYQVYCEYKGVNGSKEAVEKEYRQLVNRVPFLIRSLFLRFCKKNLKRLLMFELIDVREIASPR